MGQRYDQDLELRIEMVEKYRIKQSLDDHSLLKRSNGVSIELAESPANLVSQRLCQNIQSPQSTARIATLPYLLLWLRSGKNLDLCLLALCSCILSLLCHQTVSSLPSSPTLTVSSVPVTTPTFGLSRIDLVIKAGLFTTSSQTEEETEQSLE